MTLLYPNLCCNGMCYKGTALKIMLFFIEKENMKHYILNYQQG